MDAHILTWAMDLFIFCVYKQVEVNIIMGHKAQSQGPWEKIVFWFIAFLSPKKNIMDLVKI